MLEQLKADVLAANLALPAHHLVTFTWGNVSAVDETRQWMVIKPSGVEYDVMTADDMVVVEIASGKGWKAAKALVRHANASGALPSLCRNRWHCAYPLAPRDHLVTGRAGSPRLGHHARRLLLWSHPCTRLMTAEEINGEYEYQTGEVIIETLEERGRSPAQIPAVLVHSHGPFAWEKCRRCSA